jgi:hypothetical protein
MDTETSQAFAKVLEYISGQIGDFATSNGSNITEYIESVGEKIVMYKAGIAWLWIVLAAIVLVAGLILIMIEGKGKLKTDGFLTFIGSLLLVGGVITIMVNAYTLVACYTFPEKVILDYIQSLYSSSK